MNLFKRKPTIEKIAITTALSHYEEALEQQRRALDKFFKIVELIPSQLAVKELGSALTKVQRNAK